MSSGTQLIKNGAVTGTGAPIDVTSVGYRPRRVMLYNETGVIATWTDTMTEGRGIKQTGGAIAQMTAGQGITPLATGFRIGVDADVNATGERIHWTAQE